jgi:hypothetical protein
MTRKGTLVCLAAAAMSACASADLDVMQAVQPPAREVTLTIDASTPAVTPAQVSQFRTQLTSRLAGEGVSVVPTAGPSTAQVHGTVDHYDRGNRALRYFVPFAGEGTFDSSWHVADASGNEIGHCRVHSSIMTGAWGGSYEDVLDEVAKRVAGCLLNEPKR